MGKGADATALDAKSTPAADPDITNLPIEAFSPDAEQESADYFSNSSPSDEYDGDVAAEPGIAVDKEAGAFRVSLAVSTDEKGLLGFTMEQPSNEVLKMRADAPCAREGLLQLGDQIEGMDGVELHQASAEKVPGSIKRLLVVRYDETVADALLIARPALESTAAMPGKEPLELLRLPCPLAAEGAIPSLRVQIGDNFLVSEDVGAGGPQVDDLIIAINSEGIDPMLELPEEVKRLQDEKLLNLDDEGTSVNVVVIRGLNAVPFSHKPAAPPVNIPMGRPVSSAVDAGKPASEAASSVSSASEMRAAAIGRAPSAVEEATMKNVLGMLQPSGTSTPQEDDEADAEMQMKALERVAEHLPPVSTANAAELAAALLMTGPELRLFFDSKTDMMGRCGRTELEEFLLEVTKTKAVVPQAQRLISVRCFVGEICNRAKREALLWEELETALVCIASSHRALKAQGQVARFVQAARKKYVVSRAFWRRGIRAAHLHHHQRQSGLVPSTIDNPAAAPARNSSRSSSRNSSLAPEMAAALAIGQPYQRDVSYRDLRQMDNARHGGAISLVWPTGRELHRTGECAPLTFSEVLRYLPTIGAPEPVITDLASKDKPPPFNVLEEIAQEYGGTLKDVGHLRDQLAEREIEKEAEDRAMRHGHFGPSVEAPPLVAHLHNDVVNRARDVTIEKEQVSTAGGRRGSIHKQSAAQVEDVDKTVDDAHANNTLAAAMAVSSQAKRHDSRERKRGGRNSIMRKSVVATESPRVNAVPHTPLDRHESKGSALGAGEWVEKLEVRAEPRLVPLNYSGKAYFIRQEQDGNGHAAKLHNVSKASGSPRKKKSSSHGAKDMEAWCGDMTPRVWDITDVDPSEGMGGASERFSGATDLTRNDSLNSKASGGSGGGRKSIGGDVTPPLTVKGPSFGDGEPGPSLMELGQQKETERLKRRASVDPMLLLGIRESDDSLMIAEGRRPVASPRK